MDAPAGSDQMGQRLRTRRPTLARRALLRRPGLAFLGPLALGALLSGVLTRGRPAPPILRSVALATRPVAMVLDPPTQRAFVLGADADTALQVVDLSTARSDHGPEPLAHVALVQPGLGGNLVRCRGRKGAQHIKEPGAMADREHQFAQHIAILGGCRG